MKTITLNIPLKNFDGTVIKKPDNKTDFLYKDALVRILGEVGAAQQTTGDIKLRAYQLGGEIQKAKEKIDFDNHDDFDFVFNQVKSSQSFAAVVIGQLMEYFDKVNERYKSLKKKKPNKK